MTKKPVTDIAASVKQRLINRARADGTDVNLYWTRYVAERFLYRLSVSPHAGDFILKGAMLLVAWSGQRGTGRHRNDCRSRVFCLSKSSSVFDVPRARSRWGWG